jgi:hypothetical protein
MKPLAGAAAMPVRRPTAANCSGTVEAATALQAAAAQLVAKPPRFAGALSSRNTRMPVYSAPAAEINMINNCRTGFRRL